MSSTALLLTAALAAAPSGSWDDVELPRGFLLDLGSGVVSNRVADGRPALEFLARELASSAELRVLAPGPDGGPRQRLERGEGEPTERAPAEAGLELAFDLGVDGWGYLRVLSVSNERVALEVALAPETVPALERRPGRLEAHSREAGVELHWPAEPGQRYRIARRALATGAGMGGGGFELAGEVEVAPFLDTGALLGVLYEYRVARAGLEPAFGARARGAAGVLPPDAGLAIQRGQSIDLLTGRSHEARADLTVDFVGNNGAHLGCGAGVRIRMLSDPERALWELEPDRGDAYRDQKIFVRSEHELGAVLAEGIFARLRIEAAPGGSTILYRQVDLSGARTFPPPPPPPEARWSAAQGVSLRSFPRPPAGREVPFELTVEREEGYQLGTWTEVARVAPEAEEVIDDTGARRGLARYRFRIHYGARARGAVGSSIPGPPRLVLLGDDGGPDAEALLERALVDLASPDYEQRLAAQGVLSALGPRAWPRLRELLGSEDPELVAAARDLLASAKALMAGASAPATPAAESAPALELAPVLLRARAEAAGLGEPPPGFLSADPDRRALALLRAPHELERADFEDWRELIAVADPDPGLRLVASAVGAWAPFAAGEEPHFAPAPGGARDVPPFDLAELAGERFGRERASAEVLARLDPSRPWTALVRLELLHALAAEETGVGAAEQAALGESLLARHAAAPDETTFLAAALELVELPGARLRAALDLARLRLARLAGPPGVDERRVVRLAAADTQTLIDELESLRLADAVDVDLVLPPGVYEPLATQQSLAVGGQGLRVIGEGRVVLRSGLMIYRDSDVVLESLVLAPEGGTAVHVDRASVLLRDCYVDAPTLAVQGNSAVIELARTEIVPRAVENGVAGSIRAGGLTMVLARDCRIASPTGAIAGAHTVYLERCVISGGESGAIEGRPDGDVLVLDCFLRAKAGAVLGNPRGVLEGAIIASEEAQQRALASALVVCPVHVAQSGPAGEEAETERATTCPLGR